MIIKTEKIKLIEGVFSADDAREILNSVYSSKIKFHQMKNFSSKETTGKNDKFAIKRIEQLKKSLTKILKSLDISEKKGLSIELSSFVLINHLKK